MTRQCGVLWQTSQGRAIDIAMDCRVVRLLWRDSRWLSLLPTFRSKGHKLASKYFQVLSPPFLPSWWPCCCDCRGGQVYCTDLED